MPDPVVEPRPPFRELRLVVLLEAQEASYFAASLRISSFSITVSCATLRLFVPSSFSIIQGARWRQRPIVAARLPPGVRWNLTSRPALGG